jgi:hypothetical protein
MKTAILTSPRTMGFQAGGVLPPGLPQGDQPQPLLPPAPAPSPQPPPASPVQSPPGAAGPTTPAAPPPTAQLTPSPVPQQPPTAINTGAAPINLPPGLPQNTPDDVDISDANEHEARQWKNKGTVQGDGRYLADEPTLKTIKDHAEYDSLMEQQEALRQVYAQDTSKTKRDFKIALGMYKDRARQMQHEIDAENRRNTGDFNKQRIDAQKEIDAKYDYNHADQHLADFNDQLATQEKKYTDLRSGGSGDQRLEADMKWSASPFNPANMSKEDRDLIGRDIISLNQRYTPKQVADIVLTMSLPTMPGSKPINGFRGQAGASYTPKGTDYRGNYIFETPQGMVRISPLMYDKLKQGRYRAYNSMKKWQTDIQQKLKDQDQGGMLDWLARQTDTLLGRNPNQR